ncbi:hypothetical protein PROFUN_02468 [Planoprotostelium fungivorum]|uniref:Uncharacterized protein n=1 Tax=Planoprotostelium fungivorum TaxID=1890364 RepID=A0A2P6MP12_9EUKA|nr:hypothetical protein PROFUN_02468 [Planoprotostelium fungivorum]
MIIHHHVNILQSTVFAQDDPIILYVNAQDIVQHSIRLQPRKIYPEKLLTPPIQLKNTLQHVGSSRYEEFYPFDDCSPKRAQEGHTISSGALSFGQMVSSPQSLTLRSPWITQMQLSQLSVSVPLLFDLEYKRSKEESGVGDDAVDGLYHWLATVGTAAPNTC